jgi:pyridoxine kinase
MPEKPPVIVVNSLVSRGSVGGRASLFALERLGFPVVFVPTVLLPWHPGHGPGTRVVVDAALIEDQARSAVSGSIGGCLTGYFGTGAQVEAAIGLIGRLREAGPAPLVLCDPVVGDGGRFYVPDEVRESVMRLAATAEILTPNRFELAFLAGRDFGGIADNAGLVAAARSLGRPEVVVTSAFAGAAETGNLLVTPHGSELVAHRVVAHAPHGTGDLLAALYLGHRLGGATPRDALERATGATLRLVELAAGAAELPLAAGQDAFFAPPAGLRIETTGDG